jgi:TRAP transporter TAXI family solute receptor
MSLAANHRILDSENSPAENGIEPWEGVMPAKPLRRESSARTWGERARIVGPAFLLSLLALIVTYRFVERAPARHIVFATAKEDGAYFLVGLRYQALLAPEGVDVTVRATSGSVENIRLLQKGEADVAFVQGGTGAGVNAPGLRSLASLYFEPVWILVRKRSGIAQLDDLKGKRVGIDQEGSGTREIALLLLADNGINQSAASFLPLGGDAAANALRTGELDAAFFVISPRAPVIHQALAIPGVRLLSIKRAPAYALEHPFLSVLTLPEGAIDLRLNLPTRQTELLAPATTLVVRQGFHPALAAQLLTISQRIFGEPGMFEQAGDFPSRKFLEFPISDAAKRFFHSGPPLLQRYLPFWAADLVDRMKIMLLPLITLIYPLFKLVPQTYDWRMRSRINRWYKNLQAIEEEVEARHPKADVSSTLEELDRLEASVGRLSVPLAYANPLYTLRSHIALLRDELRYGKGPAQPRSASEQGSSKAA